MDYYNSDFRYYGGVLLCDFKSILLVADRYLPPLKDVNKQSIGLVRPYYIDYRIEEKVELLDAHLEEQYPDETCEFLTVPPREDGYESMNPYIIEVTFETEPTVHYGFSVTEEEIKPVSYWGDNNEETDLKHWE